MNRVLVYCTNNKQWVDYCEKMLKLADESITIYLEIREEAIIEHRNNAVFLKVTPENFDDIPVMFKLDVTNRVYMCDKDEWDKLAVLNKMGRGL